MKQCNKCFSLHNKKGVFCSRSCANSRSWSILDKEKKRQSALSSDKVKKANSLRCMERNIKTCACGVSFKVRKTSKQKHCSVKCSNEFCKRNTGGYRERSGRSKSGYYNGIYCGSTYELCWVIYALDNDIKFTRFDHCIEDGHIKYYPDFLLDDDVTIIEIKGFEDSEKVKAKTRLAESKGYEVNVLYKEDLKHVFKYVSEKFNTTKFYTLYDEYKPKYNYTCNNCNIFFSRDKKLKTSTVFCSRYCAGKFSRLKS
jgi:hypothetical protein